jgi:hypothetical protein
MSITATTSTPPPKRYLSTNEVRAKLGYAQTAAALRFVKEQGLPARRLNKRYLFVEAEEVDAWLQAHGLAAASPDEPDTATSPDPERVAAQVAKFSSDNRAAPQGRCAACGSPSSC